MRRYVITGGPGAGKSTLIGALGTAGFATVRESGRDIIRTEMERGGTALPWTDTEAFARAMAAQDKAAWSEHIGEGIIFHDRGLPDVVGYRQLSGLCDDPVLDMDCRMLRYGDPVFIAPPWAGIYHTDDERRQDFAEAERTFEMMRVTYTRFGYRLIELPRNSVADRMAFLLREINVA